MPYLALSAALVSCDIRVAYIAHRTRTANIHTQTVNLMSCVEILAPHEKKRGTSCRAFEYVSLDSVKKTCVAIE